jgi:hypothetical protein
MTTVMAAELGPLARVGIQRQLKRDGAPTFRTYAAFVEQLAALASHDASMRARLRTRAMSLVPQLPPDRTPALGAQAEVPIRNDGLSVANGSAPAVEESSVRAGLERSKATVVWTPGRQPSGDDSTSEPSIEIGAPVELRDDVSLEQHQNHRSLRSCHPIGGQGPAKEAAHLRLPRKGLHHR